MSSTLPPDEATLLTLMAYLDDELTPAERRSIEARLVDEPDLQEVLAGLSDRHAIVREALEAAPLPADLASSILESIARASVPPPEAVVRPMRGLRRFSSVAMALALPAAAAIFFVARSHPEAPHALELPLLESTPTIEAVLTEPADWPEGDESAPLNDGEGVDLDEVEVSARSVTVFTLPAVSARVHGTSIVVWMDDDDDEGDSVSESAVERGAVPSASNPP